MMFAFGVDGLLAQRGVPGVPGYLPRESLRPPCKASAVVRLGLAAIRGHLPRVIRDETGHVHEISDLKGLHFNIEMHVACAHNFKISLLLARSLVFPLP
ncbi:hypothetical protein ACU4GD_38340 [Cupriavidus basilensis]